MNKRLLYFLLFIFTYAYSNAQLKVNFSSDTIQAAGGTVDVDVFLTDFTNIVAIQFSVNWDPSVFSFNSVQNITTSLPQFSEGNIGTPVSAGGIKDGQLTVSWNQSSTEPANLPAGTKLFTIRLSGVGQNCTTTQVQITNTPRQIEVISNAAGLPNIGVTQTPGVFAINNGNCTGGGGNMDGVGLIIKDLSASRGTEVCIPVKTKNFTKIASVQTGIKWNPAILSFKSIKDAGLKSITANSTNSSNGELVLVWVFDTQAITVADDSTLFQLCYDVVGNTGQTSTIDFVDLPGFSIEISDDNGTAVQFFKDNGLFSVGSGGGGGNMNGVGLIAANKFTNNATNVCVPISTRKFTKISAIQGGISFDPAILTYTGVNSKGLPNVQIGDGNKATGELRVLWTVDLGSNSVSLTDNAELFELCFDVKGSNGQKSPIGFINIPFLPIEVVNEDGFAVEYFVQDGSVTVGIDPNAKADLRLTANTKLAEQGDTTCIDVRVFGFTNIQGFGFTMVWDSTVIKHVDQRNFNLPNLSGGSTNFNRPNAGKLRVNWTPPTAQTVADSTAIFQVCYEAIGDCVLGLSSNVSFVNDLTNIEFIGSNNQLLTVEITQGSVKIDTCKKTSINILSLTNPSCSGDKDGAVAVSFSNLQGAVICTWRNASGTVVSSNCNLVGVIGGSYTLSAVVDNKDTLKQTVALTDPAPLSIAAVVSDKTCTQNTSIALTVTGGTTANGNYTYTWTNSLTNQASHSNIAAGTYQVTVTDDKGCKRDSSFTVSDKSIVIDAVVTKVTNLDGNNGAIALNPASGSALKYSWSNAATTASISNLIPGNYSVTITDTTSCQLTQNFSVEWGIVSGDRMIEASIKKYNGFGITCNGESDGILEGPVIGGCSQGPVVVMVDGNTVTLPVRNLKAGQHQLRIQDACGNIYDKAFTISQPSPIDTLGYEVVDCPGGDRSDGVMQIDITGGAGAYKITTSAGTAVNNTGRIESLKDVPFTIVVEDQNGCQVMFRDFNFEDCAFATDACIGRSIISPNGDGINDEFIIGCLARGRNQPNELYIYDRWGNLRFESNNYDNTWQGTDMNNNLLPEGGYMWVLRTGNVGTREINRGTVSILR